MTARTPAEPTVRLVSESLLSAISRRFARWGLLVLATTLAVVPTSTFLSALNPPLAGAAPRASGCSSSSGVIVVVDLRPWGGRLEWGCDPRPTTGLEALHVAGFTTAGDDQDGDAFVCRIDGYPPPSQESCVSTPPASAYWSYWHADAGRSTWTYSLEGASSYHPPAGSIDAWVFGATNFAGTSGIPPFSASTVRTLELSDPGTSGSPKRSDGPTRQTPTTSESGLVWGVAVLVVLAVTGLLVARRRRRLEGGG